MSIIITVRPKNIDEYRYDGDTYHEIKRGKGAIDTPEEAQAVLDLLKDLNLTDHYLDQYRIFSSGVEYTAERLRLLARGIPFSRQKFGGSSSKPFYLSYNAGVLGGFLWAKGKEGGVVSVNPSVGFLRLPLSDDHRTAFNLSVGVDIAIPLNRRGTRMTLAATTRIEQLFGSRIALGGEVSVGGGFEEEEEGVSSAMFFAELAPTARFLITNLPNMWPIDLSLKVGGQIMVGEGPVRGGVVCGLVMSIGVGELRSTGNETASTLALPPSAHTERRKFDERTAAEELARKKAAIRITPPVKPKTHVIQGITIYENPTPLYYENGKLKRGTLARKQEIEGKLYPQGALVRLDPNGKLKHVWITSTGFQPQPQKPRFYIELSSRYKSGEVKSAILAGDQKLDGIKWKGTNYLTLFHANGRVRGGWLAERKTIQKIPFKAGTVIYLDENGKLEAAELEAKHVIHGRKFKPGTLVVFDEKGKIKKTIKRK